MTGKIMRLSRFSLFVLAAFAILAVFASFPMQGNAESSAASKADGPPANTPKTAPGYRAITWDDLLPKDWNPLEAFKDMDFSQIRDDDPRAIAALQKLKTAWDDAPIEASLDGQRIRLAGFVIPLDSEGQNVSEALLLPYFGACIHSPPPPANQIIHVVFAKPAKMRMMDAFWISGKLSAQRGDSGLGVYGYLLSAERAEPYD
jgi:hypothetical protein